MGAMAAAPLSEWLELMLAEVARKRADLERARLEQEMRERESAAASRGADRDPKE
jgi:hypothetical protein